MHPSPIDCGMHFPRRTGPKLLVRYEALVGAASAPTTIRHLTTALRTPAATAERLVADRGALEACVQGPRAAKYAKQGMRAPASAAKGDDDVLCHHFCHLSTDAQRAVQQAWDTALSDEASEEARAFFREQFSSSAMFPHVFAADIPGLAASATAAQGVAVAVAAQEIAAAAQGAVAAEVT